MNGRRERIAVVGAGLMGTSIALDWARAGFDVTGVDVKPQPRFPFAFVQADAMTFPLDGFDAIHASPPCQRYSNAQRLQGNEHPDLIAPTRARLVASGKPWVMENVRGAPLPEHLAPQAKMGRRPEADEYIQAIGNFSGVGFAREAMDVDWMARDEIAECIPPAYTEFIGRHLVQSLDLERAA